MLSQLNPQINIFLTTLENQEQSKQKQANNLLLFLNMFRKGKNAKQLYINSCKGDSDLLYHKPTITFR